MDGALGLPADGRPGRALPLRLSQRDLAWLGRPGRDERWATIDLTATAFAGFVLIGVIIAVWLYEIASGRDGSPYAALGAVAGVAYIGGVAWGRFRR